MNIIIINIEHQPRYIGGIKRVCTTLANNWKKNGNNVYFVCFCDSIERYSEIEGIHQFFFPNPFEITNESNQSWLLHLIDNMQIDIILNPFCNEEKVCCLCGIIRELRNIPVVSALHFSIRHLEDTLKHSFFSKWKCEYSPLLWLKHLCAYFYFIFYSKKKIREANSLCLKNASEKADMLVLLSEKFLPALKKEVPNIHNVRSISNPIIPLTCKCNFPKEPIVLWAGRVEYGTKRTDRILCIWSKLCHTFPNWRLVIMGSGAIDEFKKKTMQKRIGNVVFTGFCNTPEEWYKRSSIICATSSTEGFGMTLLEGIKYGCVPIAYNSYESCSDIIEDGVNGFWVPPFKESEYCTKLSKLMASSSLRNKMMIMRDVLERFNVEIIAKQWLDLFETLIKS